MNAHCKSESTNTIVLLQESGLVVLQPVQRISLGIGTSCRVGIGDLCPGRPVDY